MKVGPKVKEPTHDFTYEEVDDVTNLVAAKWQDGGTWVVSGLTIEEYKSTSGASGGIADEEYGASLQRGETKIAGPRAIQFGLAIAPTTGPCD